MCLASKYLTGMREAVTEIENGVKELTELQSFYDKELSEVYHRLETEKFNASEGYYFAKRLQEILQKRRVVKKELANLKSLSMSKDFVSVKKSLNDANSNLQRRKKSSDEKEYMKNFQFDINDVLNKETVVQ